MYKIKALLIGIIAFLSLQTATGQNNTNSPYTRFGYGEISDNNSGEQRGMGGVAIGARSNTRINSVNPASYSSVDSLTFMFDFGASAMYSNFSDALGNKQNSFNANLEYLTMQFRLFKGVGFSAGILPYSFAGYKFQVDDYNVMPGTTDTIKHSIGYNGKGGFTQAYGGLSVDLFKHISLGANMYYMFGNYTNSRTESFNSSLMQGSLDNRSITANDIRFRYGMQLYNTFSKNHNVTLGLIYEPKTALKADARQIKIDHFADTIDISNSFELPQTFGGGLYYSYGKKLSVGLDYSLQQWNDISFYGQTDKLTNRSKIALGVEYVPKFGGAKYSENIQYRFGLNTSNPYYKVPGTTSSGNNFGVSFGVGLPLYRSSTMINMAVEYQRLGSYNILKENYFKFTFNFALSERWFNKFKL